MTDLVRLILLVAIAGTAVTAAGSFAAWWQDEDRRLRRLIRRSLGGEPDAVIVARGRNAAAGVRLDGGQVVVMWNGGAKALLYKLAALEGAELLVDGVVAARVHRGEARRALDRLDNEASQVTLRLIFDDARDPDFDLDLWLDDDHARRDASGPRAAIQEARSWLQRVDAILKRPTPAAVPVPPPASVEDRPAMGYVADDLLDLVDGDEGDPYGDDDD